MKTRQSIILMAACIMLAGCGSSSSEAEDTTSQPALTSAPVVTVEKIYSDLGYDETIEQGLDVDHSSSVSDLTLSEIRSWSMGSGQASQNETWYVKTEGNAQTWVSEGGSVTKLIFDDQGRILCWYSQVGDEESESQYYYENDKQIQVYTGVTPAVVTLSRNYDYPIYFPINSTDRTVTYTKTSDGLIIEAASESNPAYGSSKSRSVYEYYPDGTVYRQLTYDRNDQLESVAVYVYAEESEAEADFKEHADADAAKKAEELGDNRPDQLQYLEVLLNDTPVRYRASDDGSIYMRFNAGVYVYVADTRDVDGTTWYSDGTYWIKGDSHVLLRTAEK